MSHKLIEQNLSIVAGTLLMLESARIDKIRKLPSEYGVWEVSLKGDKQSIQRLPSLMVSGKDTAQYPQLAPLSIMALAIHNNKITFNGDVVYEFDEFILDDALAEFKDEYNGVYAALSEMLDYLAELTAWMRKDHGNVNLTQYVSAVLAYLTAGNESHYPELAELHRRTLASLYINYHRDCDRFPNDELALLQRFDDYRFSEGRFHTPSGAISRRVVDIIAKTVFLTK